MDPVIALLVVCFILLVALILDHIHANQIDRMVLRWADNHGFQIIELRPYIGSPAWPGGPSARGRRVFLVRVLDPDDQSASFLVRTGIHVLGGCIRPLEIYAVDEAGRA